jgi:hypothetical protein
MLAFRFYFVRMFSDAMTPVGAEGTLYRNVGTSPLPTDPKKTKGKRKYLTYLVDPNRAPSCTLSWCDVRCASELLSERSGTHVGAPVSHKPQVYKLAFPRSLIIIILSPFSSHRSHRQALLDHGADGTDVNATIEQLQPPLLVLPRGGAGDIARL